MSTPTPKILFSSTLSAQLGDIPLSTAYWTLERENYERIARGVYLLADLPQAEREAVVREHAIRIALAIYPNAALAGVSALRPDSAPSDVLLITRRYAPARQIAGALRIRSTILEKSLSAAYTTETISDSLGTFDVKRLNDLGLLLHALQAESRSATAPWGLTTEDRLMLFERARKRAGSTQRLVEQLTALGTAGGLPLGLKRAIGQLSAIASRADGHAIDRAFHVFWHGVAVGRLSGSGEAWAYEPNTQTQVPLALRRSTDHQVPGFLCSLLAERAEQADSPVHEILNKLQSSTRLLSNIALQTPDNPSRPILDVLEGRLKDYRSQSRTFTGELDPELKALLHENLDDLRDQMTVDLEIPRISGVMAKLPVHLDRDGRLSLAKNKAFTHILKIPPAHSDLRTATALEWFGLNLMRFSGAPVEEYALVNVSPGSPAALLAERFDLREGADDKRNILAEDFWSILGLRTPNEKYNVDMLRLAEAIKLYSTSLEEDSEAFIRMAIMNWMIVNGDAHAKNFMMLKVANAERTKLESVRLSPAFDVMSTAPYFTAFNTGAGLPIDKRLSLSLEDFIILGKALGLSAQKVVDTTHSIISRLPGIIETLAKAIRSPESCDEGLAAVLADPATARDLSLALAGAQQRINSIGQQAIEWRPETEESSEVASFNAEDLAPPVQRAATPPAHNSQPKELTREPGQPLFKVTPEMMAAHAAEMNELRRLLREDPAAAQQFLRGNLGSHSP